jgi:hypothetical protein
MPSERRDGSPWHKDDPFVDPLNAHLDLGGPGDLIAQCQQLGFIHRFALEPEAPQPQAPNEVWSIDFVSDSLGNEQAIWAWESFREIQS